ncbi:Hypothetical protein GLP15_3257 [Giardia lamblia P15]|uniref:PCI domain-containing protein n=1 Tax=Giardia intestinalis (strain P15) TaxID=658858 RepID=E1EWP5_GIAIA|nr:Hypothetical protein GLP15_3257 [Giardia lamblia P15]
MTIDLAPLVSRKDWHAVSESLYTLASSPEMYKEGKAVSHTDLQGILECIKDCTHALDKVALAHFYAIYVRSLPLSEALEFIEKGRSVFNHHPEALSITIASQYLLYTTELDPITLEHAMVFSYERQLLESLSSGVFSVSSYAEMMALEAAIRYAIVENRFYDIYLFYQRMVQIAITTPWAYSILSNYFCIAVYSSFYICDHPIDLLSLVYNVSGKKNAEHPCTCADADITGSTVDSSNKGTCCGSPYCISMDSILSSHFPFKGTPAHNLLLQVTEGIIPSDIELPEDTKYKVNFLSVKDGVRRQALQHRFCKLLYDASLARRNNYPYRDLMDSLELPSVLELESFILDAMRANLLVGTLNTVSQTLTVSIIQARTVSSKQVAVFSKRLHEWADRVAHCRSVLDECM